MLSEKKIMRQMAGSDIISIALGAIILAYSIQIVQIHLFSHLTLVFIRTGIYLFLFFYWGRLIKERVLHVETQRYFLLAVAFLNIWVLINACQKIFSGDLIVSEILKTLSVLPLLILPVLLLFIAITSGNDARYKVPKVFYIILVVPLILFILVSTNDFHSLIYYIEHNVPVWEEEPGEYAYTYGNGFWILFVWSCLVAFASLIILNAKCRIKEIQGLFSIPMLIMAGSYVYSVLYILGINWVRVYFADVAIVLSILFMGTLEACLLIGIIPSNFGYAKFFHEMRGLPIRILDKNLNVIHSTNDREFFSQSDIQSAIESPFLREDGEIVFSAPIKKATAIWLEENHDIANLNKALTESQQELRKHHESLLNSFLCERNSVKALKKWELELFLHLAIEKSFFKAKALKESYNDLIDKDNAEAEKTLRMLIVVLSLIKRKGALEILRYKDGMVASQDLYLAIEETIYALSIANVNATSSFKINGTIYGDDALMLYSFYEDMINICLDTLSEINVRIEKIGVDPCIRIKVECSEDVSIICEKFPDAYLEEGEWGKECMLRIRKGEK